MEYWLVTEKKAINNMNKKNNYLSISVVIPTYNSGRTIGKCLKSIIIQDFPKNLVEIIIVDGGSTDNTLNTVNNFGVKLIKVPASLQNPEYNKGIGVNSAKNDLLLMVDHDNILPNKEWLKNMMQPILENKNVVGVEPLRFHYDRKMKLMDRYFALIGGADPVAYYLGKNSHLSYIYDEYNLLGSILDKGKYYLVKFSPEKVPAIGGNGALVRRKIIMKYSKSDPNNFFHIDVHVDLIKKGYNNYAILKDTIIHLTHSEFFSFLNRRKYFVEKYYFEDNDKRRYSVFDPKLDKVRLIYYVIISLTIIKPLYDATRGFIKIKDIAWYMHPIMSFCMVFVYGIPISKRIIFKK